MDELATRKVFGTILAHKADDADLYFQYNRSESWALEEGEVKSGSYSIDQGAGGRFGYAFYTDEILEKLAHDTVRQALVNLDSRPAPAGVMSVVLGPGWPGVLLHEAIGHGLEGDFNRKGTSAFSGRVGERVAAPGVTVSDDGTTPGRRGSLSVDDEGHPTTRSVLIEA